MRVCRILMALGVFVASAGSTVCLAGDSPRKHKGYRLLVAAFSAVIAERRPLEENCRVLHGPTGDAALDDILKPYFDRQAAIPHGAAGFPIVDCKYTAARQGRDGRVIMMNPTPDQLAIWIVSACTKAGVRPRGQSEDACMAKTARMVWEQANAQFPITGYVPEPANLCEQNLPATSTALFGFRDGVTVGLVGTPHEAGNPPNKPCKTEVYATCTIEKIPEKQISTALSAKVSKLAATAYARLSNLPLSAVLKNTPENHCPSETGSPPEWLGVARKSYLDGLGSQSYDFLERWIKANDSDTRFTCKKLDDADLLGNCKNA